MRQLDLFGSLIDTPADEKKPAEKQLVLEKKENDASNHSDQETPYSLVGLAEEMLGSETAADAEIHATDNSNINFSQESEIETRISLGPDKIIDAGLSGSIFTDDLQTLTEFLNKRESEVNNEVTDSEQEPAKGTESEINKSEIFEEAQSAADAEDEQVVVTSGIKEKKHKELQKRGRKSLQEIEAEADLIAVPEDEVLLQKQYYPISEVAKWFRVNNSLLRFWENEFDVLKPKKNKKGDRLFRPEDVKNLQLIYHLLRQRKYTIEGAKEYLRTHRQKADLQLQLTHTLQKFKGFLLDLKANL